MAIIEFDKDTLLTGRLVEEDSSFSHEFGTERSTSYYVRGFEIWHYHKDHCRDITRLTIKYRPELYKELEEFFYEKMLEKLD